MRPGKGGSILVHEWINNAEREVTPAIVRTYKSVDLTFEQPQTRLNMRWHILCNSFSAVAMT